MPTLRQCRPLSTCELGMARISARAAANRAALVVESVDCWTICARPHRSPLKLRLSFLR